MMFSNLRFSDFSLETIAVHRISLTMRSLKIRTWGPSVQRSRVQALGCPVSKRPGVQSPSFQASRCPGVQSPSVQSSRVQTPRVRASRLPESKRPESGISDMSWISEIMIATWEKFCARSEINVLKDTMDVCI